ncbi:MAG: hypothetical protein ABIJ56_00495 [Pseudomonadota bacterium]
MPGLKENDRAPRGASRTCLFLLFVIVPASCLAHASCDLASPEVVVVNMTDGHVLLRNVSFNGCRWNAVLAYEESTSPGRCLTGDDRVHFEKFDARTYCGEQVDDGTIDELCFCGEEDRPADDPMDPGLINEEPTWFNYQTLSVKRVDYGEFHVFEITLDDMEQDFSVPGPYGH